MDGMFYDLDAWMKIVEKKGKIGRHFRIRNLRFMAHNMVWMRYVIDGKLGFRFQKLDTSA